MLTARDSIFASQTFRRYFVGQAFSYVGDGLRFIAIPLLVFHLTKSAVSLGFTYVLEILPFALAGLIGGSLADSLDRKRLMISCDFVRFCIITALQWVTGPIRSACRYCTAGLLFFRYARHFFWPGSLRAFRT